MNKDLIAHVIWH